jgi:hypothetical protein
MAPLMQDARAVAGAPMPALPRARALLAALVHALARLPHGMAAAQARRAGARANRARERVLHAGGEACAVEGASVEFNVLVFDGRPYGAVYVDGRLNCLLPGVERL